MVLVNSVLVIVVPAEMSVDEDLLKREPPGTMNFTEPAYLGRVHIKW